MIHEWINGCGVQCFRCSEDRLYKYKSVPTFICERLKFVLIHIEDIFQGVSEVLTCC